MGRKKLEGEEIMTDEERVEAAARRYERAMHAVQSGIAMRMDWDEGRTHPDRRFTSQKHMRAGVDSSHVTHLGLATLLIAKGIFTKAEYTEAMADAAEKEKASWEETLSTVLQTKITLA
jgi:hypothetical protein